MKTKLLFTLCMTSMLFTQVNAQGGPGFLMELLYPMSGSVSINQPQMDLIFGHDLVIQQEEDSVVQDQWHNLQRYETPKDANGRFTKFKLMSWDPVSNQWTMTNGMFFEYSYSYNAQQKLTAYNRITHINDTMGMKESMTYLNSGPNGAALLGNAIDSIITTTMSLPYGGRVDSFEYSGNNLTGYSSYMVQGSSPDLQMKVGYTYNASGKAETMINYRDDGSGNIMPESKTTFTYDASGNIAEAVSSNYNVSTTTYVNSGKVTYSYVSGTARMSQEKQYDWNNGTSAFDLESTVDYHYNAANLVDSAYETDANDPTGNSVILITYDAASKPQLVMIHSFDGSPDKRIIYSESPSTGLNERSIAVSGLSLYPNPSDGILHISNGGAGMYTLTIMDLTGKEVLSATTSNGEIDATSLQQGIYFFSLSNNGQTKNGKLIIE